MAFPPFRAPKGIFEDARQGCAADKNNLVPGYAWWNASPGGSPFYPRDRPPSGKESKILPLQSTSAQCCQRLCFPLVRSGLSPCSPKPFDSVLVQGAYRHTRVVGRNLSALVAAPIAPHSVLGAIHAFPVDAFANDIQLPAPAGISKLSSLFVGSRRSDV